MFQQSALQRSYVYPGFSGNVHVARAARLDIFTHDGVTIAHLRPAVNGR